MSTTKKMNSNSPKRGVKVMRNGPGPSRPNPGKNINVLGQTSTLPKKFRKRNRPRSKSVEADRLMKEAGAHGANPLSLAHREKASETIAAVNQDASLDVVPQTTSAAIQCFALGIILAAKKRGWNTQNVGANQFQAFGYLVSVIRAALQGSALEFTSAPRWFVEILAALRPKTRNALTSRAYYEMTINETAPAFSSTMALGTADEAYSIVFGDAIGPIYNGFSSIVPAPAYDPVLGKEQFSSLWNVFVAVPGTPSEMISPGQEKPYLANDCSAFAMVSSRLATGFFTPGGVNQALVNEVHIDSPILSRFCSDNEISDEGIVSSFRAGFFYANGGGTACYLGPRCLEFQSVSQFKNKSRQVFKFYNLYRFYEVMSLIIGGVQERAKKQTAIVLRPYPLTVQRMLIMLRQTLLPFFSNEMAQDLRMKNVSGPDGGIVKFLPCTCADNGVSQTALTMSPLFPKFYTEIIKGCFRVLCDIGGGRGIPGRQTMDFVPILSVPVGWIPTNYSYIDGEGTSLVYREDPSEAVMNITDCSVVDGPNTFYLSLNGTEMSALINAHNEWMTEAQPFLTGLCKATASHGSPVFCSVVLTQIVRRVDRIPAVPEGPANTTKGAATTLSKELKKQTSMKKMKGSSLATRKVRSVNPVGPIGTQTFEDQGAVQVQSNVPFLKEIEKYQMLLIAPEVETVNRVFAAQSSYLQSVYGEYISAPYGATVDQDFVGNGAADNPTLFTLHQQAADLDLKNVANSGLTEIEQVLDDISTQGGGGFLSILSKVLSGAGKAAMAVGGMLE